MIREQKQRPKRAAYALLMGLLLPITAATQNAWQPLESIRDTALTFAQSQMIAQGGVDPTAVVTVGALDPRLRLPACEQPLDPFLPNGMQWRINTTIGVRCPGATPWTLYVPVRITETRPVVVLIRPTPRGTVLTAQDIDVAIREVSSLGSGYYEDPVAVLGKVLTRPGSTGQALHPALLTGSLAVRRGQQVTLLANSGGVLVRMTGTAIADGSIGERIQVRNGSSTRIVEGVVREDGMVEIGM